MKAYTLTRREAIREIIRLRREQDYIIDRWLEQNRKWIKTRQAEFMKLPLEDIRGRQSIIEYLKEHFKIMENDIRQFKIKEGLE